LDNKNKKPCDYYIFNLIGLIAYILLTVIPAFLGMLAVNEYRPKKRCKIINSYINYNTCELIERRECSIYFGKLSFLKEINLHKVPNNTILTLSCKPLTDLRIGLPADCYEEKAVNSNIKIKLLRNKFYEENEVELIFINERTKIEDDFKENIIVTIKKDTVEIINNNFHEIRKFPLPLPNSIDIKNIFQILGEFKSMTTHQEANTNIITIYLDLPATGERIIPLPS